MLWTSGYVEIPNSKLHVLSKSVQWTRANPKTRKYGSSTSSCVYSSSIEERSSCGSGSGFSNNVAVLKDRWIAVVDYLVGHNCATKPRRRMAPEIPTTPTTMILVEKQQDKKLAWISYRHQRVLVVFDKRFQTKCVAMRKRFQKWCEDVNRGAKISEEVQRYQKRWGSYLATNSYY